MLLKKILKILAKRYKLRALSAWQYTLYSSTYSTSSRNDIFPLPNHPQETSDMNPPPLPLKSPPLLLNPQLQFPRMDRILPMDLKSPKWEIKEMKEMPPASRNGDICLATFFKNK